MKKLSIKTRVTFWYVAMFIVILAALLIFLLSYSERMVESDIKGDLAGAVDQSIGDVRIYDGKLSIDKDMTDYIDGKNILVIKDSGLIITGLYPEDFLEKIPFVPDEVRKVTASDSKNKDPYFVYDREISNKKFGSVWVRGITSAKLSDASPATSNMIKLLLIAFPFVFAFAILIGYYITRRAFAPIGRIIDTASGIQAGTDLSKRIALDGSGKDEIYMTAKTFDDMLDRLEASFETERQFTNDASHELRTPLSVIMAQSELALESLDDKEETEKAFRTILEQSQKMATLINQLLTLAKADREVLQINRQRINLSLLLQRLAGLLKTGAEKKSVYLLTEIDPDIATYGDAMLLERLFENLISNGVTYNNKGGFVKITLREKDGQAVATVEDNGIGISADALPKIWDRFYREDKVRTSVSGGNLGLGLPMVKHIADAHNAKISLQSEPGRGTCFTIAFERKA